MNLENEIRDIISTKLNDGTIEKAVSEQLEKCINNVTENLFKSYGEVGKKIEEKIEKIMVPAIESHDFSTHLVKLDAILTEIVNSTALQANKKILENFKEFMVEEQSQKNFTITDLFEKYCEFVADNVETSELEVYHDDEPYYESVNVSVSVEHDDDRKWSLFKHCKVIFECEEDENMNYVLNLSRYSDSHSETNKWDARFELNPTISSLRYMSQFEVFLAKLARRFCDITIDEESISDTVTPTAKPEPSWT